MTEKDINRFWSKVNITNNPQDCWVWTRYKRPDGYGEFCLNGYAIRVHRLAWFLTYGEIPNSLFVCHHCDNPACCNPQHLFLGTQLENMIDMKNKNRKVVPKGEKHGSAKLTSSEVAEIRQLYLKGNVTQRELAIKFRVSHPVINNIINNKTWKLT